MAEFGWKSSGILAADAVIRAGGGKLGGCAVISDGTNAVTLTLYDNASAASGTALAGISIGASPATGALTQGVWFGDRGVTCINGIYADITQATGTIKFIVWYE